MDTYDEYKLKKRIDQLELEISRLMNENTNFILKIEALSTTLAKHYNESWFDQTVSF